MDESRKLKRRLIRREGVIRQLLKIRAKEVAYLERELIDVIHKMEALQC